MASEFPRLSLDLSPPTPAISSTFPEFLTRVLFTKIVDFTDVSKLQGYIIGLEDELNKIQAFKRELPLSFHLLNDAISRLKELVKKNEEKGWDGKLDASVGVKSGINELEKKNWMSSAQLWSPPTEESKFEDRRAILSFTEAESDVPELSLVPSGLKKVALCEPGSGKPKPGPGILYGSVFSTAVEQKSKPDTKQSYQTARKRRRSWSPELHQRFVEALEKLGGSQVATPKQIRELMQVDGLTNDEVKSHLQKYRLHVRKLPTASTTTRLSADEGVDSGDLQHSSSPKGPLHSGTSRKCNSSSVEEDEEEKSDGHSWKARHQT